MLSKALLIFYIIIASQYTSGLLGKQMRTFLEENRIAQHVIGFIMMLAIMITLEMNPLWAVIAYILFIFSTKLDIQWNLIFILLIFIGYLYESEMMSRINDMKFDETLTGKYIDDVRKGNITTEKYIIGGISAATIIGMLLYMRKKNVQYGGGFSPIRFFLY